MARLAAVSFFGIVLLVACVHSPTENVAIPTRPLAAGTATTNVVKITPTIVPTPTSRPDSAPSKPTIQPSEKLIHPFAEAPMIILYSWSPDSMWLAYWTFTAEEAVNTFGVPRQGAGQLHFLNPTIGQTCQYSGSMGYGDFIFWQTDGSVIVVHHDSAKRGFPCDEPFTTSENIPPLISFDPSLSPGGQYRIDSLNYNQPDGTINVVTRITNAKTGETENVINWKHPGGVGEFGLGGDWLSPTQFLIPRTLDQGPLLIEAGKEIVHVAQELFDVPPLLDSGVIWQATGAVMAGTNTHHLLLFGSGVEANFPLMRLYHSETRETETLPFQYVWGTGFSPDGQWLLLDKRPTRDGFQSQDVWFRPVDPLGSLPRRLSGGFRLNLLWSSDWKKVASTAWNSPDPYASRPSVVRVLSFPEAAPIGSWKSEDYTMTPSAWSPDDRFLVVRGDVVGVQREALFVIPVP